MKFFMEKWQSFFSSDYLKFSEEILTKDRTNDELQFLINNLELTGDAKILDLGCGQGRISIPLAKYGYNVTGLDASRDLLEEAKNRAKRESVSINFIYSDMRNMNYLNEYDAVINMGTAFGYVERQQDDEITLKNVYRALRPNGVFIQDLDNREAKVNNYNKQSWYYMNNKFVWNQREFNYLTGRWNEIIKWEEHGEEKEFLLNLRLYTASEIIHMNQISGLQLRDSFGYFNNQPYSATSPRMIMKYQRSKGV